MSAKKKIYIMLTMGIALGVSSCKKYLNVNQNPNVSNTATARVLLPTAEGYIASALGVDCNVNGGIWAQYWTQNPNSSQYRTLEQYQPTQANYETPWQNLYLAGENLKQLYDQAGSENKKQYQAISLLLKAYTFQVITDAWGDVPYGEALRALTKDGGIKNPRYDAQKAVYTGIIALIDSGNKMISAADPSAPGGDDLVYAGDMGKWQKFAYTLKLRCLLRLAYIDPATAQAGIAAMPAPGSGAYLGEGEDAQMKFTTGSGNKNPLFSEEVGLGGTQNLVGSKTIIDTMNEDGDDRAYIFYEYLLTTGAVAGIAQGDYNAVVAANAFSIPSTYTAGDATDQMITNGQATLSSAQAPVKFLTGYESLFLQAEAVARGWAAGDDASLFVQGIHANFFDYSYAFNDENILWADTPSVPAPIYLTADFAFYSYMNGDTTYGGTPAYWSMYPSGGSVQQKLQFIITQKWLSMCGSQGFEAWTEWRRTGYPDFLVISKNSLIGNQFPQRFLYPATEATENSSYPGLKSITTKVWWDAH